MTYVHPEYLISPSELAQDLDNQDRRIFDVSLSPVPSSHGRHRSESGLAKFPNVAQSQDAAHHAGHYQRDNHHL